jgi:hypothetical protein
MDDEVTVTGSRLGGVLLIVVGAVLLCVMLKLGVRTAVPQVFRVMIVLILDIAIPLFFLLWGLHELCFMERYEIINSCHDLRVVRRSLLRTNALTYHLEGSEISFVNLGLTGLGAGFTRWYELRIGPPGQTGRVASLHERNSKKIGEGIERLRM